ncbi:hypothetical protein [Halorubrum sp. DTA46]|uniref:hypothetical protein n=1 Tax=Halorubrum sp. DTA46 TaxID=3402162 RepID=UPI003AB06AA5
MGSAAVKGDVSGVVTGLFFLYAGAWLSVTSRYPIGTNVFEREWDALIVLDSARVDAMREVAPEYEFIETVDSIWSVGSNSQEWYVKTFDERYADSISETALISSNPNARAVLEEHDLEPRGTTPFLFANWNTVDVDRFDYVEFTRDHKRPFEDISDRTETVGTIQGPSYVTERAIAAGRGESDRLIVHYFQPHRPFVHGLVAEDRDMTIAEERPYETIASGGVDREELYSMYLDNLRVALDSIEELLENLDAEKVVITSDHAELLGELGQYGHFLGVPHPALKKVPWVETTAEDHGTIHPDPEPEITQTSDVRDQLKELGYL